MPRPWTPQELQGIEGTWADWIKTHTDPVTKKPVRSHAGWRQKRAEMHLDQDDGIKTRPVDDDPETNNPELRRIMQIKVQEEWVASYEDYHRKYQKMFPRRRDLKIGVDHPGWIAVALMSDWHIGSAGMDIDLLKSDIDLICSHPHLYTGLGGDVIDNFILPKMASAAQSSDATVQAQWRLYEHYLTPLVETGSLLWTGSGNHDAWSVTVSQTDPLIAKLNEIGIMITDEDHRSHIGEGGYIDLRVGPLDGRHETYVFWRKHKPTRFRSSFNITHWHKQMLRGFLPREWEIGIGEHIHTMEIANFWYRLSERFAVNCGSYKTRDDWAEDGGFMDGGYGVPTAVLNSETHEFHVFSSIHKALQFLDGPVFPVRKPAVRPTPSALETGFMAQMEQLGARFIDTSMASTVPSRPLPRPRKRKAATDD